MMRRGLWQQKQRQPSACLLCRFSYSHGPYTQAAPRSPPSRTDGINDGEIALTTASPGTGRLARWYSVAADKKGLGGLGSTVTPRRPLGAEPLTGLSGGAFSQRFFTTSGLPSWATQPAQTATSHDGLLPHERAARERAMGRSKPSPITPTETTQPTPSNGGLLPHEPATREKALARTRPSHPQASTAEDTRPAVDSNRLRSHERSARDKGRNRTRPPRLQRNSTEDVRPTVDGSLLRPHGRLAKEQATGRTHRPQTKFAEDVPPVNAKTAVSKEKASFPQQQSPMQAQPAPEPKNPVPSWMSAAPSWSAAVPQPAAADIDAEQPVRSTDSLASLLPHERAARERATAARRQTQPLSPPPQPEPSKPPSNSMPQDKMSQEYLALQNRRNRPYGTASGPKEVQQAEESDPFVPTTQAPRRKVPRYDLPRSSTLARTPTDQDDWKNLTRRERSLLPGLNVPNPSGLAFNNLGQASQETAPKPAADPFRSLEKPTASQSAKTGKSADSGFDQFKVLENKSGGLSRGQKKKKAIEDREAWAWTEEYAEEARQAKVQRVARELSQETEHALEDTAPNALPSSRGERDDRRGRPDRYGREDAPERREKTKKPKNRRRQDDEEDDWDEDYYEERRRKKAKKAERERQRRAALEAAGPTPIFLPEFISVSNLAIALGQKVDVFVRQLEELGFEDVGKDNILTGETAALVAQEYGFEPTVDAGEDEDLKPAPAPADPSSLPLRPPVVTIMGHVDHGKTTLLDYLRKSSIVSQEHGGITQHIGAFSVNLSSGKQITFLDTPGHAAFLSMRQRGANVTDMVVLVVAADDSVMPQTIEALKHARAAKVPIIVAISKMDKPEANIERVKSDLATHGVEIEDYGGDVQVVCVSGKTGQGMDDLEENILLLSEMLDIRADPGGMAEGWVLESTIKPIGRVATVLVKRGTLRPGDFVVAGRVHAKVRSLRNEAGVEVDEAPPGTAVEVLGWKEPPDAGDQVLQAPDEARAKSAVRYRQELKERAEVITQMAQQEVERREREREREREKALAEAADPRKNKRHHNHHAAPPEDLGKDEQDPADKTQYVTFLVKGDVHGSVEAVTAALLEQGNNEIRAKVLLSASGQITESDVEHAAVSGSAIINFNNPIPHHVKRLANDAGVKILEHNVIYHLVEEVKQRLADALPPLIIKKVVGEADVLQVFPINVKRRIYKNIAGCRIGNGYVKKGSKARVIRNGENIFEGVIETLKHVKKDVTEMRKGSECGMSFAEWDELQEGDHIQILEEIAEKRKL
ncbi:hypothetical protein C7999DRAFT_14779 [Corynascus novoguineensis]|uniref:Translation initiation factor IF-2, mitochondrial n=1 Tax=Corynascus novoguineensis TaxID=1126955 RepID=A0AAN7CSP6_9PEZI|nr:hypothetical protein C7999DRAFT_14779 [Corynascus novoguineensis]